MHQFDEYTLVKDLWGIVKFEIDIIIPIHNSWELSERCLSSVIEQRRQEIHRVIVIDDGSDSFVGDKLSDLSKSTENFLVLAHSSAKGFSASANAGLRHSDSNIVIILNSDTEVSAGWLEKIASKFEKSSRIGIVGPLSNAAGHQSIPRNSTGTDEETSKSQTVVNLLPENMTLWEVNQVLEENMPDHLVWTALVHGFCFAIRRETIREVGLFDEEHFPRGYGEENDYCLRATNAGWGHVVAVDTYVWHYKSGSFSDSERAILKSSGRVNLDKKHGEKRITNVVESSVRTGRHIEKLWADCRSSYK